MKRLYFILVAIMAALTANAVDYYLTGGFCGWSKDENCKFANQGDGTYTLDFRGTLTSGFKINDGTWGDINYGGNGTLAVGQVYNLVNYGANIEIAGNIEDAHIVLNPAAMTLLITGKEVKAEYTYCIHGTIGTGTADWADVTDLTETGGKWVAKDVKCSEGTFGIKKNDKSTGTQVAWIAATANSNTIIELDAAMPCKIDGLNWSIAEGTYDFSLDLSTMTLTVSGEQTGDSPAPDYTTWAVNILGDYNSWADNSAKPDGQGISRHTGVALGAGMFKIKIWTGSEDLWFSTGSPLVRDTWTSIPGDNWENMTVAGATPDECFDVDFNCATKEIKVSAHSGTGSVGFTAADNGDDAPGEYFDLNGRRVANPTSGIYMLRKGSKVSKTIINPRHR